MPVDRKPMRFAHSEGQTDVCYDETGGYLLTCGSDGDVRIYKDFDDSDPESVRAGENVTVLLVKNKKIVTASDNSVQVYTFPEGSPDGILTRFTASVNHICFNQSGSVLAAGASDFNIKVVTVADGSQKVLRGHEAPVLSVTMDPKDQYAASSSCDGTVKIWNLDDQTCKTTLSILPRVNDARISKTLCRLAWQPEGGKYMAVPVEKTVKVYERDTWKNTFNLEKDGHSELVSLVSWSPCGNYIASASINGEMFIWKVATQAVIERITHESGHTICGLAWNPKGNKEIAYTDNQGQFGVCENVIPNDEVKSSNHPVTANDFMDDSLVTAAMDADSDDEQLIIGKKKQRSKSTAWIDEEADDDDDDDEFKDIRKLKAALAAPLEFGDGGNDGDTGSEVSAPQAPKKEVIHTPFIPVLQPPFQPGSTPVHLMHRFMVWNSVGIVRCHTEDEISSIEVEFHDTSTHHPLHLTNHLNHTMAALSSSAVLLACKAREDSPSKLVCIHFGSWDNSKEWTVVLPEGESIQAVATGSSFAAVATDKRFLRIFTIGGVQRDILSLPGAVVCMSGYKNQLMVVFHINNPLPGEQALALKLLDLKHNQEIIVEERVLLSEKSTLGWLGFSEEGSPVTVDSAGVVRLLSRSFGTSWSPVCVTKSNMKNKSDNYWVVGLDKKSQQIRCIYCKGSTYPPTLPRPVLVLMPLELPFCEMTTEKGQLEEAYIRSKLMYGASDEEDEALSNMAKTTQIQSIMKLFALACKSDREFRAMELCELLPDAHSVSLAIKYAARSRRMNLANRLDELAREKAKLEAEEEFEDDFQQIDWPVRGNKTSTSRMGGHRPSNTLREVEQEEEEEEMEETGDDDGMDDDDYDDCDDDDDEQTSRKEERKGLARLNSLDLGSKPISTANSNPPSSPLPSSNPSQGRSNPFRISSPGKKASSVCGKSFFDSVEEEKKASLQRKSKISPDTKPVQKRKKGKQTTLLKTPQEKEKETPNKKTSPERNGPPSKKVNGFTLWFEENKEGLSNENPELTGTHLVKSAMRQWKALDEDEKMEWNNKAKGTAHEKEQGEKKRKREKSDEENEDTLNTINLAKKTKESGVTVATSKLAGFAYNKN